jgi:hypothetical protein
VGIDVSCTKAPVIVAADFDCLTRLETVQRAPYPIHFVAEDPKMTPAKAALFVFLQV